MTTLLDGNNYVTMGKYFKRYSSTGNNPSSVFNLQDPLEGKPTWGNLPKGFDDGLIQ